jgi:hypothetical protein
MTQPGFNENPENFEETELNEASIPKGSHVHSSEDNIVGEDEAELDSIPKGS